MMRWNVTVGHVAAVKSMRGSRSSVAGRVDVHRLFRRRSCLLQDYGTFHIALSRNLVEVGNQVGRAFSSRSWNQRGIASFSCLSGASISRTNLGSSRAAIQSLV